MTLTAEQKNVLKSLVIPQLRDIIDDCTENQFLIRYMAGSDMAPVFKNKEVLFFYFWAGNNECCVFAENQPVEATLETLRFAGINFKFEGQYKYVEQALRERRTDSDGELIDKKWTLVKVETD